MDSHFEQNALSWGAGGAEWLKHLPDMISEYEAKWDFKAHEPFELNYNYVASADLADGTKVVIKIGYPEDREFQSEITALQTFDGNGICRLLQVDQPNAVMLLEQVVPGTVLGSIEDDDKATRTIAHVMKQLHKPLPETHNFITITEWVTAIPEYKAKHGNAGVLPTHLVDKAGELFTHLIATSAAPMLLHGDLHHHNVLLSDERGCG
ncbi:MAG TPA: aminoglycoside phosphotransferase family protein [Candidatus Saccharimonadales bacterium]|jgi:streptomycin 6-kinase